MGILVGCHVAGLVVSTFMLLKHILLVACVLLLESDEAFCHLEEARQSDKKLRLYFPLTLIFFFFSILSSMLWYIMNH